MEEAVLINTGGGVAGGDRLECRVTALAKASITVTSQAAEKGLRAWTSPRRSATKLKICCGRETRVVPQETILFNRARLCRNTEIEVSLMERRCLPLSGSCWDVGVWRADG